MLDIVKRFFSKATADNSNAANQNTAHDLRVATCALFVEMARIDQTFTQAEMEAILSILKEKYGLSGEHADALIEEADKELDESVDLFTGTVFKRTQPELLLEIAVGFFDWPAVVIIAVNSHGSGRVFIHGIRKDVTGIFATFP